MMNWKSILVLGLCLFAVSFVLPVDRDRTYLWESGTMPGWEAFQAAIVWGGPLGILSALTNAVMLGALAAFRTRRRGIILSLLILCLFSVLLNGLWLLDADGSLRVGYYLWWGSFMVVALGLYQLWKYRRDYSRDFLGYALFT